MIKALINNDELATESLIIYSKDEGILYENLDHNKINVRSIAKLVISLACGVLIDKSKGGFNEDTLIYELLKNKVSISNKKNLKNLKKIRVKHCLTHTMGYRDIILMSKDIENIDKDKLLSYSLSYPLYYKPGEKFLYSNAGYFVLAAAMQEHLGYNLYDFIYENLFTKIGIYDTRWDRYGKYLAGATKLYLSPTDLLKLGKVILGKGNYDGRKLLPASWVEKMSDKLYNNKKDYIDKTFFTDDFYGYGLWTGKDDIYYSSGSGGQLVSFLEKEGIIIVATNSGDPNKAPLIKKQVSLIIEDLKGE